jgi:hypothetical protein
MPITPVSALNFGQLTVQLHMAEIKTAPLQSTEPDAQQKNPVKRRYYLLRAARETVVDVPHFFCCQRYSRTVMFYAAASMVTTLYASNVGSPLPSMASVPDLTPFIGESTRNTFRLIWLLEPVQI